MKATIILLALCVALSQSATLRVLNSVSGFTTPANQWSVSNACYPSSYSALSSTTNTATIADFVAVAFCKRGGNSFVSLSGSQLRQCAGQDVTSALTFVLNNGNVCLKSRYNPTMDGSCGTCSTNTDTQPNTLTGAWNGLSASSARFLNNVGSSEFLRLSTSIVNSNSQLAFLIQTHGAIMIQVNWPQSDSSFSAPLFLGAGSGFDNSFSPDTYAACPTSTTTFLRSFVCVGYKLVNSGNGIVLQCLKSSSDNYQTNNLFVYIRKDACISAVYLPPY